MTDTKIYKIDIPSLQNIEDPAERQRKFEAMMKAGARKWEQSHEALEKIRAIRKQVEIVFA